MCQYKTTRGKNKGKNTCKKKTLNVQVTGIDTGATDNVGVTVLKNNTTDGVGTQQSS